MKRFLLIIGILVVLILVSAMCVGLAYLLDVPEGFWNEFAIGDYYDNDPNLYADNYNDEDYEYYDDEELGDSSDPGPPQVSAGPFAPADCPFPNSSARISCGYLGVPEDHASHGGNQLTLAVAIVAARLSSNNPPLIYLEGGPGGSALDGAPELWLNSPLADERDVILIDQRGTGYSYPSLNCTEYDSSNGDDQTLTKQCKKRLEQEGINLGLFNSAQSAADIASLRLALGYQEVDLLGVSYGTRLALTVMRDHPTGIRSVILDSVYPPQVDAISEQGLVTLEVFQTLADGCQADSACNQAYPDLFERLTEVVKTLNDKPAVVTAYDPEYDEEYEREIIGDDVIYDLIGSLYDTATIPYLPAFIHELSEGNYDLAYEILDLPYQNQTEEVGAMDYVETEIDVSDSEGMFNSVECYDEAAFSSISEAKALLNGYDPIFVERLVWDAEDFFATCEMWLAVSAPPIEDQPVRSDIPTLLLNGEYDPVTPPKWAQAAADYLPNSQLFIFPGYGHAEIDAGTCPPSMMLVFLEDPNSPVDDNCLAEIGPPDFVINP